MNNDAEQNTGKKGQQKIVVQNWEKNNGNNLEREIRNIRLKRKLTLDY